MWRAGLVLVAGCSLIAQAGPSTSSAPARSSPLQDTYVTPGPDDAAPTYMPILSAPADPWLGVAGDKPVTFGKPFVALKSPERWLVQDDHKPCTAARDHCLPAITWIVVQSPTRADVQTGRPAAFRPDGPDTPYYSSAPLGRDNPYIAYRTVPATRTNLVPGVIASAIEFPDAYPTSPIDAFRYWHTGTVDKVDWDMGFVYLVGREEPMFITGTRVAVMSYTPGGKVTILGGKKREELGVALGDVILPAP